MSLFVKLFQPRFASLVESGAKLQTVRPRPKRMPKAGDTISLRAWTGKPYRSKQRVLRESVITGVDDILITRDGRDAAVVPDRFAVRDGFRDWAELVEWFDATHGLPFEGILIQWKP